MFRVVPVRWIFSVFLALPLISAASPAQAEEVTLELKDGDMRLTGRLMAFDGESYVIEAQSIGRITVSVDKFRCVGNGCPGAGDAAGPIAASRGEAVSILGSANIGAALLPQLIRDYSDLIGARVEQIPVKDDTVQFIMSGANGAEIAGINVRNDSSAAAFEALARGDADIAMASRPVRDDEIGMLTRAGFSAFANPNTQHSVGMDAIALIVSPDNPVSSLSLENASRIFSGEIADWSDLGAPPGAIAVHALAPVHDGAQIFDDLVMKPYMGALSPQARLHDDSEALAAAVAEDPRAIGLASLGGVGPAKAIGVKDTCGLLHEPSAFAVLSGEYPISSHLYLYSADAGDDVRSALIRFALSPAADAAVEKAGFVPKAVRMLPFDYFRGRIASSMSVALEDLDVAMLRQLVLDLDGGFRLSTTLRFKPGSTELTEDSVHSLDRLIAYLTGQDLSARRILLAGYSDTSGQLAQNKALSLRRAEAARDMLLETAKGALQPDAIEVKGYGEVFPVACNDTETGRDRNRRVEIWLLPTLPDSPSVLRKQL